MNKDIERKISRARTHLLLDHPWFGALALRLRMVEGKTQTMANNGSRLYYNSAYVDGLEESELIAIMAHEVMHCALGHMYRAGNRDFYKWNVAADIAINQILRAEGFKLPFTELAAEETKYPNMSAEEIYSLLEKEEQKKKGQPQNANGGESPKDGHSKCECGLEPAERGSGGTDEDGNDLMTETDWQIAAEQATAVANKAGKLPAHADRAVKANEAVPADWRAVLRRFVEQTVPSDYSWMVPNRRLISQGYYMPGVIRENTPRIGVAIDTSGSIDKETLRQFSAELTAILHEARPESVDVVYCDYEVQGKESFNPDDSEIKLKALGGGGTSFQPALDVFSEDPPACVIYLTDLYGSVPREPEYPVLWAVIEGGAAKAPFGEYVKLSKFR